MLLCHAYCCTFVFVTDYFLAALVEINIEKDHLLDAWHVEPAFQVEIYLVTPTRRSFEDLLTRF